MIYLFTAIYQEAKPIIRALGLKRQPVCFGFDIYGNEELRLLLTGTGSLPAATAVGACLAHYQVWEDMLVNWGSCGASLPKNRVAMDNPTAASDTAMAAQDSCPAPAPGTVFRCNKLTDRVTGYTYYPDMLLRSSLPEAAIITEPAVWSPVNHTKMTSPVSQNLTESSMLSPSVPQTSTELLHDMEAAAVYYAGSYFLSPHQMHFLKVVTDYGVDVTDRTSSLSSFEELMEESTPVLLEYIDTLRQYQRSLSMHPTAENSTGIEELFEDFHCSQTMRASLLQCIRYWTLAGTDHQSVIQKMRDSGELPCRDRREGKKRLEQLKRSLL